MGYKWLSEYLMAVMFHQFRENVVYNRPQMSFSPSLGVSLWWWWGEVAQRLRLYLSGVPPTATITAWLEIPIWDNCYGEEIWWGRKLIGSIKWIERLKMCLWEHCFSRCQYYDIYIMIYSSILKSSHSEPEVVLQLLLMSRFGDLHCFINYNC